MNIFLDTQSSQASNSSTPSDVLLSTDDDDEQLLTKRSKLAFPQCISSTCKHTLGMVSQSEAGSHKSNCELLGGG